MSFQAMAWAIEQDLQKASAKFILIMLSNYCDSNAHTFPSINRLCKDTGLDRKTIILCLDFLEEIGLIKFTGKCTGSTESVKIYQLIGVPCEPAFNYVYKTYDPISGEFYIGKRYSRINPNDDSYKGSGKWVLQKLKEKCTLVKEVLENCDSWEEAVSKEQDFIRKYMHDPKCMNECTPIKFKQNYPNKISSSPKIGTASQTQAVPIFPISSPVFPSKQSQKRDTEPISTEPIIKPVPPTPSTQEILKMIETFWSAYPKKRNRVDTEHAFSEVKAWLFLPDILKSIEWQKKSEEWTRENGRWIPMPSSYLREMRWMDEPTNIVPVNHQQKESMKRSEYIQRLCSQPLPE